MGETDFSGLNLDMLYTDSDGSGPSAELQRAQINNKKELYDYF